MVRKELYSINEVLSNIQPIELRKKQAHIDFDGDLIAMSSHRYHTFKYSGIQCVECGLIGVYFVKERFRDSKRFHFNLYALDENGNEVLMTKDHIIPKSLGGADSLENYQTMCCKCNEKKGNKVIIKEMAI